jgi:hypothetical protein
MSEWEPIKTWLCPDCNRVTCECPGAPRSDGRCLVCGVKHDRKVTAPGAAGEAGGEG